MEYTGKVVSIKTKFGRNGSPYFGVTAKINDNELFWFSRGIKTQNAAPIRVGDRVTVAAVDTTRKGNFIFLQKPTLLGCEKGAETCRHGVLNRQPEGHYECAGCAEEFFVTTAPEEEAA